MSPAEALERCDQIAGNLARCYQSLGIFSITVRDFEGGVRAIYPQRPVEWTSEYLRVAAEKLFNGPEG